MPRPHPLLVHLAIALALGALPVSALAQAAPERSAGTSSARPTEPRPADVVRTIERTASRIQHMLGELRRAGDARQARCVDATLSQITATLRLALDRITRATRFDERGDAPMAERERALIVRLQLRARELEREARRCVDPEDVGPNRTRVTTIIEPSVPTDAIEEPRRREGLGAIHRP